MALKGIVVHSMCAFEDDTASGSVQRRLVDDNRCVEVSVRLTEEQATM